MTASLVNIICALVVGLATGVFFERRATKAARRQAAELQAELTAVRHSIYSVGRGETTKATTEMGTDLAQAVKDRAIAMQDASGRVNRAQLIALFVESGWKDDAVADAIDQMRATGEARIDGRWLEMR